MAPLLSFHRALFFCSRALVALCVPCRSGASPLGKREVIASLSRSLSLAAFLHSVPLLLLKSVEALFQAARPVLHWHQAASPPSHLSFSLSLFLSGQLFMASSSMSSVCLLASRRFLLVSESRVYDGARSLSASFFYPFTSTLYRLYCHCGASCSRPVGVAGR